MRLTLKLTIGLVVAILPVIAVNSGVRVDREIDAEEADLHDDDLALGGTLAGATAGVWRSTGEAAARLLVDGANRRQHRVEVRWTWLDARPEDRDAPFVPPGALAFLVDGEPFVTRARRPGDHADSVFTYVAVTAPTGRRGAIEVRRSLAAQQSFIRHTIQHAATATMTVVGLCGFLALGLGTVLVGRPVNRLVAQTRRIGAGDLSARLRLVQHDELGQLGGEIDIMCDRLVEARDRLDVVTAAKIAALEQVRHADRLSTVGKLAAGIAHEIGTPLNVISGHAQLITADHAPGSAEHENASIVIQQTQRVAAIIRQLLDFARRRSPRRTPLEIASLVRDTLALLGPLAAEHHVSVDVDIPAGGLVCNVEHAKIQQAITNLVVNGLQAVGGRGHVAVSVTRCRATAPVGNGGCDADYVRIEVADTGVGIGDDVLPHIFEPFFTTKDVGEGTGLGLSVTYGIVKEHDGWIDVASTPGEGSRFSIFLPLERELASSSSEHSTTTNQGRGMS